MADRRDRVRAMGQRCAAVAFESYARGLRWQGVRATIAALVLNPTQPGRRGLVSTTVRSIAGGRATERLLRLRSRAGGDRRTSPSTEAELRERVARKPRDPGGHLALGVHYLERGLATRAYACLRGASTLAGSGGGREREIADALRAAEEALGLEEGHAVPTDLAAQEDPYGRLALLAGQVAACCGAEPGRVLDVGGGEGFLAALLPRADYVLAEPLVNGLTAERLAEVGPFDVAVCSHVLEHVEPAGRDRALSELLGGARRMVLLLGPFAPDGKSPADEAIWAATEVAWAGEHVENGLPSLEALRALLEARRLRFDVQPHADERVMYWQALAAHFAELAGEDAALHSLTAFFLREFDYRPADAQHPHDFLVRIWVADPAVES